MRLMDLSDPKYDRIFRNNVSTLLRKFEEQERLAKKLSIPEPPVYAAMRQLEKAISPAHEISKSLAALDVALRPIKDAFAWQEEWNKRYEHIFTPAWEEKSIFKAFHDHTAHIASILNPPVGEYIENYIRTDFSNQEQISTGEAIFLETFEQIEVEIDTETLQEIATELESNPSWVDEMKTLVAAFDNTFLTNELAEKIISLINRRFETHHGKLIARSFLLIILLGTAYNWSSDLIDNISPDETEVNESRNLPE